MPKSDVGYDPKGIFTWQNDDVEFCECGFCKHWHGSNKCAAFPSGSPDEI